MTTMMTIGAKARAPATAAHVLAPLLLPLLAGCAARGAAGGPGDAPAVRASVLMTQALPRDVGTEARVLRVDLAPRAQSAPHRHPGAVFVYVLEGEVVSALDGGEPRTFRKGETWYERPGQLHRVSRNPSATRPASLLVFFLTEPGRPVRVEATAD